MHLLHKLLQVIFLFLGVSCVATGKVIDDNVSCDENQVQRTSEITEKKITFEQHRTPVIKDNCTPQTQTSACPTFCTLEYKPICATGQSGDQRTWPNECSFDSYNCLNPNNRKLCYEE